MICIDADNTIKQHDKNNMIDLLRKLTAIQGASSDENKIRTFLLEYVQKHQKEWKVIPTVLTSSVFQDNLILVFGKPTTAIYAHMDTVGFSVGYQHQLLPIGGPTCDENTLLVGSDSKGEIVAGVLPIEHESGEIGYHYVFERDIDRGSILTYQPNFRETESFIQSPYLDNRLGVGCALKVAETLENGVIVFSTYEEHGGNAVGFIAKYLFDNYQITQALISDITWITDGISHGKGVAISLRDSLLPRKSYLDKILQCANRSGIPFQLEVEQYGGSDGSTLQKSALPIDWCFIGAAEDHAHSPNEKVHKTDIQSMIEMYNYLMTQL